MGMCCEKKMMIGWRNVWSMKLRVQDQEEDQRGPGETEVVRQDCQARKMNKEDAIDRSKWRKMIKDVRWSGWMWVGECFFWYRPTRVVPDQRPLNGCVCVLSGTTEARDSEWQWHQLGYMQACTSLQTDNHVSTPPLSFIDHCEKSHRFDAWQTEVSHQKQRRHCFVLISSLRTGLK